MNLSDFENSYWTENNQNEVFRHKAALEFVGQGEVLDMGCGDGLFLKMLKSCKSISGKGVDISSVAVGKCKEAGIEAEVYDFVGKKLTHADKSYDYVILLDVLEHVYDPIKLLKEAKRLTRNNIVLSVPNFNSLPCRLQVLRGRVPENNKHRQGHVYWFNYEILNTVILQAGLEIEDIKFNTFWKEKGIISSIVYSLALHFPNLFALSFVVKAK